MTVPATVVLADDHPLMLKGLNDLLSNERDFTVLAQCTNGDDALRAVRAHRPDIVVLDLRMPGTDGLSVMRAMKAEKLATRVVLQCLRKVHAGEPWIERRTAARAFETLLRREAGAREISKVLTPREIEVARLASMGLRNKA